MTAETRSSRHIALRTQGARCIGKRGGRRETWIPVIVISGHAGGIEDVVELMKLDADDVIEKPYDADDVARRVRQALERSGRTSHGNCRTTAVVPTAACVIEIPGTAKKRRTIVRIGGVATRSPSNRSWVVHAAVPVRVACLAFAAFADSTPPTRPARTTRTASTMFANAACTSPHARVLSPQSGFTHSCSGPHVSSARPIWCTISSTDGTRGEWTS